MVLLAYKCPHCGKLFSSLRNSLIRQHVFDGATCPGSGQNARLSCDQRPLWKDEPACCPSPLPPRSPA